MSLRSSTAALGRAALLTVTLALPTLAVVTPSEAPPALVDAVADNELDFGTGETGPMTPAEKAEVEDMTDFFHSLGGDLANHEEELADEGLYIVSDTPEIETTATNADHVNLPRPYVIYNTQQHRYFVTANYNWIKGTADEYWYFDGKCNGGAEEACNVGGRDGFGMRFNRNVTNRVVESVFCGRQDADRNWSLFGCQHPTNPDANSSRGVTYRVQDKLYMTVVKPDYNMFRGTVTMGIDAIPCGKTLQIFSRYAHGWDNTSLTGFDVGVDGFGMSWNTSSDQWSATSQSGSWTRTC